MFSVTSAYSLGAAASLLPDECTPLERALSFAQSKVSLQRTVVARNLVSIAQEIGYDDFTAHLFPIVRSQLMNDSESEIRCYVLHSLDNLTGFIIQSDPEAGYSLVVNDIIPMVKDTLLVSTAEPTQTAVRKAACKALGSISPHLRAVDRGSLLLPVALSLAHEPGNVQSQVLAVIALGSGLAETLGPELCAHVVVPQWCCLADDLTNEVRAAAASYYAQIMRLLPLDSPLRSGRLLVSYLKLMQDAHWPVQAAALDSLLGVLATLTAEERATHFIPVMRRFLSGTQPPALRRAAQRYLGPFIVSLLTPDRVPVDLVQQFLSLAEYGDDGPGTFSSSSGLSSSFSLFGSSTSTNNFHAIWNSRASSVAQSSGEDAPWESLRKLNYPPALCAYSFASVLAVVCGRGADALVSPLRRPSNSRPCPVQHQPALAGALLQDVGSVRQGVRASDGSAEFSDSSSAPLDPSTSPPAASSRGGGAYWWNEFRPAFLTMVHSRGEESGPQIRKPLAASFAHLVATLLPLETPGARGGPPSADATSRPFASEDQEAGPIADDIYGSCASLLQDSVLSVRLAIAEQLPAILPHFSRGRRRAFLLSVQELLESHTQNVSCVYPLLRRASPSPSVDSVPSHPTYESAPLPLPPSRSSGGGNVLTEKIRQLLRLASFTPQRTSTTSSAKGFFSTGNAPWMAGSTEGAAAGPEINSSQKYWRLRGMIASQLAAFAQLIKPKYVRSLLVPLLIRLLQDPVALVRRAAAACSACVFLRASPILQFRLKRVHRVVPSHYPSPTFRRSAAPKYPKWVLKGPEAKVFLECIRTFALSSYHRDRITYLHMVNSMLRDSSKRLFEMYFMKPFVALASDPVRNVRLAWAAIVRLHLGKSGILTSNELVLEAVQTLLAMCNQHAPGIQLTLEKPHRLGRFHSTHYIKRASSTSSVDLLAERSVTGTAWSRSASDRLSPTPSLTRNSSVSGSTSLFGNPEDGFTRAVNGTIGVQSPVRVEGSPGVVATERMGTSFVGVDAEIRHLLGAITFLSFTNSATEYPEGLDISDMFPKAVGKGETHPRSSASVKQRPPSLLEASGFPSLDQNFPESSAETHEQSSADAINDVSSPVYDSQTSTSIQNHTAMRPQDPGCTASSSHPCNMQLSPRSIFPIPSPKPVPKTPQFSVGEVKGFCVDELDATL